MLSPLEKVSLLTRARQHSFSGAFLAVAFLAMAGWVFLLGSLFLKLMLWCFS